MPTTVLATILLAILSSAPPGEQPVDHWVAQLGAARWQEREAASQHLIEIGKEAIPALERAAESKDPEIRHRARPLLDRIRLHLDVALPPSLAAEMEQFSLLPEARRVDLLSRAATELRAAAAPLLDRVLRTDPSEMVQRVALGRLTDVDSQMAVAALGELAAKPPGSAWAGAALGGLLSNLGRDAEAVAAYEGARKLNPNDSQLALALARIHERHNDWAKARDVYAELAVAQPGVPTYRMSLGRCLYLLGEREKAETVWKEAVEAPGANPTAFALLANTYQSLGAPDKALAILRQGVEKNPTDTFLTRRLAAELSRAGKTDEAITTFEKALRTPQPDYLRHATGTSFAALLRQSGQLDAYLARQNADPAETQPERATLLRSLAQSYLELGDRAAAARVLRRLLAAFPQRPEAQWAADQMKQIGEKE